MDKSLTLPEKDALTLRAILQSAAAGIVTMTSDGRITDANEAAHRLFGYQSGELIGQPIETLMPQPHKHKHAEYVRRYLTTGQTRIIGIGREVPGLRKNGTVFPFHLSVGEVEVSDQRYFTGIVTDLSAQRKAEDQSRESEALFRSIFESQPDAILITDNERRVQFANPAFEQMFGVKVAALAGQSAEGVYENIAEWERHGNVGFGVDTDSEHLAHVLSFRRADGEVFPGSTVRSVIRDSKGRRHGFVEAIRDISIEMRRDAQLLQAQRMEAIGQLTGGIAHDFNNLLTVILGNLELLQPHVEGELPISLSKEAIEAAEMGARLTDRLLTFGRRQHLELHQVNLNEFVLGSTDILRRTIGEDIDLSTALAGDLWLTDADPAQIENAVLNLAINARDAMPKGGRIVIETRNVKLDNDAVSLTPELSPGHYVVLSVSDTGGGMNDETRKRAFEPFFSTKGPGRGSGLGLATIYGFAKQSGGHATIYSELDQGTVVNLYLPQSVTESTNDCADDHAKYAAQEEAGHGEVILVVEDDARVRRLTQTRLEQLGFKVEQADSGAQALTLLRNGLQCDLVFTDLVMPGGVSGIELQRIVATEFPDVKMLLTSGYAEEFVNAQEQVTEPIWLLRKPYRQADLAIAIRNSLSGQSQPD